MANNKETFIDNFYKINYEHLCILDNINYINNHTSCEINCPMYGIKKATPINWLKKECCKKCQTKLKEKTKIFIEKAKQVHGDKYDYSKVEYKNNSTKVCIICPTHGEFWQRPDNHLQGQGCPMCKQEKLSKIKITPYFDLIGKFKKIHLNKYEYLNEKDSGYIDTHHKIQIICPIHGTFLQTPHMHLQGQNCPKCNGGIVLTTNDFNEKANKVHGNKYDYSKVEYINNTTKVCIICPIHGEFFQKPNVHLQGCGCPKCKSSHLETEMREGLKNHSIDFEEQKRFEWLGKQSVDFYIPSKKIAIECQGKQHFGDGGWVLDEEKRREIVKQIIERDNNKRQLCNKNGIKLFYYSNLGIVYPYQVYEDIEQLISDIKLIHVKAV